MQKYRKGNSNYKFVKVISEVRLCISYGVHWHGIEHKLIQVTTEAVYSNLYTSSKNITHRCGNFWFSKWLKDAINDRIFFCFQDNTEALKISLR